MLSPQYFSHLKKTFLLAYPVCLSQLGHIMVGVVDTAMVGYISTEAQAAVSLSNSLYTLFLVFGIGVSLGITPLVAAADAKNDHVENAALLKNGLLINILVGILLFILLLFISPVLYHFDQPAGVVKLAIPFLNVMMLSLIPLSVFNTFKQFTEGLSYTRTAMFISIGANLLNVILNYVMIFGKLGFRPMGLMGACWASFIARIVMALSMFLYVFYEKKFRTYWKDFRFNNFSAPLLKKILNIGIPAGFQWFFEVGAFSAAAIMIGWLGSDALASHQIALSMAAVTYMVASGIGAAATVRVGNHLGLKDKTGLRLAGFSAFILVFIFMGLSALVFIAGRNFLPAFFNQDPAVVHMTASLLIIAALFQLSDGIQVVGLGALRGLKDVKIPTIVALITYWLVTLPSSYILGFTFQLGIQGVWYGFVIGLSIAALLFFARFNHVSKKALS